jgi:hypothetical protein
MDATSIQPVALLGLGGVPVVVALVEVTKRAFPRLSPRFWPVVAIAWGLSLNVGVGVQLGVDLTTAVVVGVVAGLSAAGLYDTGRATLGSRAEPPTESPR